MAQKSPLSMFDVSGKSALVIGATGAFGSAGARALAQMGCDLTIADMNGAKLDALISWTSSAMLLVGSLAVVALPVLRYSRKGSNLARPFRLRAAWLMVLIYLGSAGAAYVVLLLRGQWQSYVPPVFLLAIWLAGKWRLRKAALAVADLGTRNA